MREAPENIALTKNITTAIIVCTDGHGRGLLRAAIATVLADASDMIPATNAVQVWTPELVLALDIGCASVTGQCRPTPSRVPRRQAHGHQYRLRPR